MTRLWPALVFVLIVVAMPLNDALSGSWQKVELEAPSDLQAWRDGRNPAALEAELLEHSETVAYVRPRYNELLFRAFRQVTERATVGRDRWLFLRVTTENYPPRGREAWVAETMEQVIGLARWFESKNTRVLLMPVPFKGAVYPEFLPPGLVKAPTSVLPEILEHLEAAELEVLDLRPVLQGVQPYTYQPNDTHFSQEGAHRVAQAIAARLRGFGVPDPVLDLKIVPEKERSYVGDIQRVLGFVPGSDLHRSFSTKERRLVVRDTATGQALRAPKEPLPIVHCGTSYSHSTYLPDLVGGELRLPIQNASVAGKGPTKMILELARDILDGKREAPTHLVWEFPERHVFVRRPEFYRALQDFNRHLETFEEAARYRDHVRAELPVARRTLYGVTEEVLGPQKVRLIPERGDPQLILSFDPPLEIQPGQALHYVVECPRSTSTKILPDHGNGLTREGQQVRTVLAGRTEIYIPLDDLVGRPLKRLRIDPVDTGSTILFEGPWLLSPR